MRHSWPTQAYQQKVSEPWSFSPWRGAEHCRCKIVQVHILGCSSQSVWKKTVLLC